MLKRGPTYAVNIKLEELAKIRYAFLYEPTLVLSSPKDLWTPEADEGAYEKAFGLGGEVPEMWSEEEFRRCLVAVAFYLRIADSSKEEAKSNVKLTFLKRLRYHALALAGVYIRSTKEPIQEGKLSDDGRAFDEVWTKFWNEARRVLIDAYLTAVDEQNSTLHALVRSGDRWQQMKKRFVMNIGVPG